MKCLKTAIVVTRIPAVFRHSFCVISLFFLQTALVQAAPGGTLTIFTSPITLSAISASETGIPASAAVQGGQYTATTDWAGNTSSSSTLDLNTYSLTHATRTGIQLWSYKYNQQQQELENLNVSYTINSGAPSYTPNKFSDTSTGTSFIGVTISNQYITKPGPGQGTTTVFGTVDLDIDISTATRSGSYSGTITTTIITL